MKLDCVTCVFVWLFVAVVSMVLVRILQPHVVREVCPKCGHDDTFPDHAVGMHKCEDCGFWFPSPPSPNNHT